MAPVAGISGERRTPQIRDVLRVGSTAGDLHLPPRGVMAPELGTCRGRLAKRRAGHGLRCRRGPGGTAEKSVRLRGFALAQVRLFHAAAAGEAIWRGRAGHEVRGYGSAGMAARGCAACSPQVRRECARLRQ